MTLQLEFCCFSNNRFFFFHKYTNKQKKIKRDWLSKKKISMNFTKNVVETSSGFFFIPDSWTMGRKQVYRMEFRIIQKKCTHNRLNSCVLTINFVNVWERIALKSVIKSFFFHFFCGYCFVQKTGLPCVI